MIIMYNNYDFYSAVVLELENGRRKNEKVLKNKKHFFYFFLAAFVLIFSGLHLIWLGVIVSREFTSERLRLKTNNSLKNEVF